MDQDKWGLFRTSVQARQRSTQSVGANKQPRKAVARSWKILAGGALLLLLPWLFGAYPFLPQDMQFPRMMGHRVGTIDEVATSTAAAAKAESAGAVASAEARRRGDEELITQRRMIEIEAEKAAEVARATQEIQAQTAQLVAARQSIVQQIEQRQTTCIASVQQTADTSYYSCNQRPRGSEGGACDVERELQLERISLCREAYRREMLAAGIDSGAGENDAAY